eukprot:2810534-Amphidinium_carterae.3
MAEASSQGAGRSIQDESIEVSLSQMPVCSRISQRRCSSSTMWMTLLIIGEESAVNAFITNVIKWMAAVWPDIHQYAIRGLTRKLSAPTSKDESAAKHLIKYHRGTQNLVFRIVPSTCRASQCIELHAYCDSDWAGCPVNRKSTMGATVAQSSAEEELDALTSAVNDLIHLQSVIIDGNCQVS